VSISTVQQNSHKRSTLKKPNESESIDMDSIAILFKNNVLKNTEGIEQRFRHAEHFF